MKQPVPAWVFKAVHNVLQVTALAAIGAKAGATDFQALTSFLQRFDKAAAYAHYLANRFHLQAQLPVGAFKFIKVPAGYFNDHIIKCRFKISRGCFGDLVFYLIKVIADR